MDIYFDGACEPYNPGGHMGWGIAVVVDDQVIETQSGYEPAGSQTSNNVAEYRGAIMALERAAAIATVHRAMRERQPFGPEAPAILAEAQREALSITIWGDSKLVIEQLSGRWKVRNGGHYVRHMHEAKTLLTELQATVGVTVELRWIKGTENVHADQASRAELEKRGIQRKARR